MFVLFNFQSSIIWEKPADYIVLHLILVSLLNKDSEAVALDIMHLSYYVIHNYLN